jgi:hypothetical protein
LPAAPFWASNRSATRSSTWVAREHQHQPDDFHPGRIDRKPANVERTRP